MAVKDALELNILGQKLAIKSVEDENYVRAVEDFLNGKINEVRDSTKAVATLDLALLAALNVTDELMKARRVMEDVEERSGALVEQIERRSL